MGAFTELTVPLEMRQDHTAKGGRDLRRFMARANDGAIVRVMTALEPAGDRGALIRHTSVSVARTPDVWEPPDRLPTDAEFSEAIGLTFEDEPWAEFPKPATTLCRHAWAPEK